MDIVRAEPDAHVVVIGCDTGARYLSHPHRWEGA
jgi:cysteine synthase